MSDIVQSFVDKVSAYNILNYLLPGAVFAAAFQIVSEHTIFCGNLVVDVVVAYFAGMTLSRIGSLIVEPLFKCMHLVQYCNYADFVEAEQKDSKLATLSQENNAYRTLAATFLTVILVKAAFSIQHVYPVLAQYLGWLWPVGLLVLFSLSYRKQTSYITKRVDAIKG